MSAKEKYIQRGGADCLLDDLGGKACALNRLERAGFAVPPWFVVTPAAFFASLSTKDRNTIVNGCDIEAIPAIIEQLTLTDELIEEVDFATTSLCRNGEWLAVRSSAVDEDGVQHSFAGQLDSFLFVPAAKVAEKIHAVWRSAFAPRILEYRRQKDLHMIPPPPAVLVQHMVNAEAAGVAFSADPVSGHRNRCVVNSTWGLADALVCGEADADTHHVDAHGNITHREIANKKTVQRRSPRGGVETIPSEHRETTKAALYDEQVQAVARLARGTAHYFGRPQDIEWAYEDGALFLLQSRPITTLKNIPDPDGDVIIWDNSNIVESYGGVTTPLTFTFIRQAYEAVYVELVRILGVRENVIRQHRHVFANMLGLIHGRVYYNLLSWYRVLAMLPGFSLNRGFMDQMMGVKEALPPSFVSEAKKLSLVERLRELARLSSTVIGMVANHFRMEKTITAFYRRLDTSLAPPPIPLEEMRADELVRYYHRLEQELLTRWDAPLINDLFAMIFYGVSRKLVCVWYNDKDGTLQNDLLIGEGGMISAEPAQRVRQMAITASSDEDFSRLLVNGSLDDILPAMANRPEFNRQYRDYLEKFGDRCIEELKLESITLRDNPLLLLRSVGTLALRKDKLTEPHRDRETTQRRTAEETVRRALRLRPIRRLLLRWVLRHARARVRDRENLRFERTRVFGRVRRIFIELGKRFYAQDMLEDPRDIFYLELPDAMGIVEGTATTTALKELVSLRRREFQMFATTSPPATRFMTSGGVYMGNTFKSSKPDDAPCEGHLQGIGCCPGIVKGIARVIRDPRTAALQPGEILVAEQTDPGWIMLFASAAGIIVERGSVLSHSAIVAREMNIPAVVSVNGVTSVINSGDLIEMDGSSGKINIVSASQTHWIDDDGQ